MSDDAKFVLILTVVAIVVGTAAVWTVSTARQREAALACPLASRTTWPPGILSARHGGGKRRGSWFVMATQSAQFDPRAPSSDWLTHVADEAG
jgi:hypothetical protein